LVQFKRTIAGATDQGFGVDIKHDILDRVLVVFELRFDSAGFVGNDSDDAVVTGYGDDLAGFVPGDAVGAVGADVVLGSLFDGTDVPDFYYAIRIATYD
jgi:hypothetical protein